MTLAGKRQLAAQTPLCDARKEARKDFAAASYLRILFQGARNRVEAAADQLSFLTIYTQQESVTAEASFVHFFLLCTPAAVFLSTLAFAALVFGLLSIWCEHFCQGKSRFDQARAFCRVTAPPLERGRKVALHVSLFFDASPSHSPPPLHGQMPLVSSIIKPCAYLKRVPQREEEDRAAGRAVNGAGKWIVKSEEQPVGSFSFCWSIVFHAPR